MKGLDKVSLLHRCLLNAILHSGKCPLEALGVSEDLANLYSSSWPQVGIQLFSQQLPACWISCFFFGSSNRSSFVRQLRTGGERCFDPVLSRHAVLVF